MENQFLRKTVAAAKFRITPETPDAESAIECAEDEYILDAAARVGITLSSSCHQGRCRHVSLSEMSIDPPRYPLLRPGPRGRFRSSMHRTPTKRRPPGNTPGGRDAQLSHRTGPPGAILFEKLTISLRRGLFHRAFRYL